VDIIILHCRNNFVLVNALLEYRDLEHLIMILAITLGVAISVKGKEGYSPLKSTPVSLTNAVLSSFKKIVTDI